MNPRRLLFLLGLVASWFLAIGVRLYQVQIARHEDYSSRAAAQQSEVVTLTPPRGTIYDRRGRELAVSVEVRSVAANPKKVRDPASTAKALSKVLDVEIAKLEKDLSTERSFVWVQRKIEPAVSAEVEKLALEGIFLLPENKRYYPFKELAAQVLGFVGTDHHGLSGLEFLYDSVVSSEPGKRTVFRDAKLGNVLYPNVEISKARPGSNLVLTLDATIQHLVERELEEATHDSRATSGMVVVMEASTGAVLAMASRPTFDPNRFASHPKESWRNRPVTDAYEPGSTFKMITLAAALEAGALKPDDVLDCGRGGIRFGKTLIKDHTPFDRLSVEEIIAKSSNVGAIKIGQAAGRKRLYKTILRFGFGRPTGIDLPSESPGILHPIDKWSPLSPAYFSFGQGLSVTALQLTNAFAAIANGGRLLRPFIVRRVGDTDDPSFEEKEREVVGLPIAPSSVERIRDMLESVVSEGTATTAAIPGYPAAGKTGTAQKAVPGGGYSTSRHVASFVGFAPLKKPEIVIAVILDEPRPRYHGGEVAAPVFRAVAEKTLLYLGVPPERERPERWPGGSSPEVVRHPTKLAAHREEPRGTVPDFAGLSARQAISRSSRLGLYPAMYGHGSVVRQAPQPGTPFEVAGRQVELWLSTGEAK